MLRLKSDLLPALLATADGVLEDLRPALARRRGADRGDGGQRLSGRLRQGQRDPRPRRRPQAVEGVDDLPRRHRTRRRAHRRHRRARAQRHARAARPWPRRASAPTRPSRAIDWPGGFCRRDIGWRAMEREETQSHERAARSVSRLRRAAHQDRGASRSICASAAPARRCSCCTAIRRPTSCGTRWRRSWPSTSRWSSPTCAATAPARRRRAMRSISLFQARHGRGLPDAHARAGPRALHGRRP